MKRVVLFIFLIFAITNLSALETSLFDGTDIKDRDVASFDLEDAGKDKLKLGISLGYPLSGITAGWQVGKSLELDLLVGTGDYETISLGGSAMISLVDIELGGEVFPLTAGPFVYTAIGENYFGMSAGALARVEYTFDFQLNLYLESGVMVNFLDQSDETTFNFPVSLGIRYIF